MKLNIENLIFENELAENMFLIIYSQMEEDPVASMDLHHIVSENVMITVEHVKNMIADYRQKLLNKKNVVLVPCYNIPMIY